jgi:hypothetical protein
VLECSLFVCSIGKVVVVVVVILASRLELHFCGEEVTVLAGLVCETEEARGIC